MREQRGWSQTKVAAQIPLSQKQLSRLELGDVSLIDRPLLIRLAEIFEAPLESGEVNQWLHAFGYRPQMVPGLPLPANAPTLLAHYAHLPAAIWDLGRFIRYANPLMEALYHINVAALTGLQQNWLWQYFHRDGFLRKSYPLESVERVLNRLFWEWEPFFLEPWNVALRRDLEAAVGLTWTDAQARYHIPSEPLQGPWSENILVNWEGETLAFLSTMAQVPFRPDLTTVVYTPVNRTAKVWCPTHAGTGEGVQ